MSILEQICQATQARIQSQKTAISFQDMRVKAQELGTYNKFVFENTLRDSKDLGFICEVKRASPSKGIIAQDFDPLQIALDYENAGAKCISCLTEPMYFLGSDKYLQDISAKVHVPLLRKDFVIDSYMIYQAKVLGAHCVLLICAILESSQLQEYIAIAKELGLSALVEVHNEKELQLALDSQASLIGANNRNLRTFEVDISISLHLKKLVPDSVVFVAESGINNADDIRLLKSHGINAVLIGEALMRYQDKKTALEALKA